MQNPERLAGRMPAYPFPRVFFVFTKPSRISWTGTDGNGAFTMKLTEFPVTRLSSEQLSYPIVRSILVTRKTTS
ncbi:MAG: hypothetical protein M9926_09985 [Lentimicrobium sp.]|uniref:hypothetical protein n=1 Tax=Lentimicrobium sp. TaxID=2034841 RepID=UPI0025F56710|nr:hypothetical protein [Lentimicrobium sp.]MCO5257076.1 hypothetical protein [Lentimicrobium sp.]